MENLHAPPGQGSAEASPAACGLVPSSERQAQQRHAEVGEGALAFPNHLSIGDRLHGRGHLLAIPGLQRRPCEWVSNGSIFHSIDIWRRLPAILHEPSNRWAGRLGGGHIMFMP